MKKNLCLVCTLFAALLLIGHPAWGAVTDTGGQASFIMDDNGDSEAHDNWIPQADYFGDQACEIRWIDGGRGPYSGSPFRIENAAPTNLLYLDSSGLIGINTNEPVEELDIHSGIPAIRLQDTNTGEGRVDLQRTDSIMRSAFFLLTKFVIAGLVSFP